MKTERRKEIFFRFVTPRTVRLTIERQLYRGVLNGALEGGKNGSYVVVKEQKTRSARISYLSEHRTLLPSSISFPPHFSLYLSLSLSILCFRSFTCTVILFQFPGFASKGAFVAALLFANLRRVYTSGFPLERSSPSYVLLYIYATTHVSNSLSTYPSIYIYIYTYYYNDTYIYRYIPLCIALSHARQITEPQVKLANSCAVLELTR